MMPGRGRADTSWAATPSSGMHSGTGMQHGTGMHCSPHAWPAPRDQRRAEAQRLTVLVPYCVTLNSSDLFNVLYVHWLPLPLGPHRLIRQHLQPRVALAANVTTLHQKVGHGTERCCSAAERDGELQPRGAQLHKWHGTEPQCSHGIGSRERAKDIP